jgi:hypothetical protein
MLCRLSVSLVLLALCTLYGCVTSTAIGPAWLSASYREANDLVMEIEAEVGGDCQISRVVSKVALPSDEPPGSRIFHRQRWMIDRCGKSTSYIVRFYSRRTGPNRDQYDTDVQVSLENEVLPEIFRVRNIAKRNHCENPSEPKLSTTADSPSRIYDVQCENETMRFECGQVVKGYFLESCWRI